MRVNKWLLPTLALALLLGTVGVAQATGWWIVSGKEMVDVANLTSGADVKGWMTLQQVADGAGMEAAALYEKLGIPGEIPPETALKDLENVIEGFEVTNVRDVVDEVMGIAAVDAASADATEAQPVATPIAATPTAIATALAQATPAPTSEHTPVGDGTGTGAGTGAGEDGVPPAVTSALDIKGRHTLQEIADATDIELADLLVALNLPPDTDTGAAVRDLVEAGLIGEIDEIRTAVTELQQ